MGCQKSIQTIPTEKKKRGREKSILDRICFCRKRAIWERAAMHGGSISHLEYGYYKYCNLIGQNSTSKLLRSLQVF